MAVELFANTPSTTVTSGGTDAPASGTQETWTVASSAQFPAASTTSSPPGQFHVGDPQFPTESIAVTQVSGTAWTVIRGAEGTIPVQHAAGFTVWQVASAGALAALGGVTVKVPLPTGETAADTPNVTAAITALTAALANGPATLQFQDGTYQIDSNAAVIQSVSDFSVRGTGGTVITQAPNRTGLVNNTTGDLMVIADCTDFQVDGIIFDGLRDTVAPMSPLTASANSGQASVTVASGQGSRYLAGQYLFLFGGLGTAEQNQSEGFGVGSGTPLVIQSVSLGGGSGGGDKITFTTNLSNSYTHISSTAFSDGFGPYAYAGAYLTSYQCGYQNSVAGRTLSGEDQQNGLHLLSCERFGVDKVEVRNIWESGVKCGSLAATALTDGCTQGDITGCFTSHGYDQGISLWVSSQITVGGCVANASGWAGISLSAMTDNCVVTGNQILNSVYRVPNDDASGSGIAIEGGRNNQVKGNIITGVYSLPLQIRGAPFVTSLNSANAPTISTFLKGGTAAGTSVQVSSSANLAAGTPCSILDRARTEALTIASVIDGTHVTFQETTRFSHVSGVYIAQRFSQENVFEGNTLSGSQVNYCVNGNLSARCTYKNNVITGWASGLSAFTFDITNPGAFGLPSGVLLAGDGSIVEGNRIWNALPGNGITLNGAQDMVIRGNYINGTCASNGTAGLFLGGVTDSVIEGNHISEIIGGEFGAWGIWVAVGGSGSNISSARLAIKGNEIRLVAAEGLYVQSADSLTVSGNVVTSCGGQGGITLAGVTNSAIQGNVANSNQNAGIYLENNSSAHCLSNRVTGNTCRDDGTGINVTSGGSWTQQYGIQETGNSNSNLYMANECDSNAVSQIVTTGTASVLHYNIISGTISS